MAVRQMPRYGKVFRSECSVVMSRNRHCLMSVDREEISCVFEMTFTLFLVFTLGMCMTSRERTMVGKMEQRYGHRMFLQDEVLVAYLKMSVEYFSGRSNKKIR